MNETALTELPDDEPKALAITEEGAEFRGVSPAQAKDNAVAAVTMTAYAKAGELKLTPDEDAKLAEDFPDEAFRPGAGGDSQLIYIEHAYLRDRLTNTLGRGAWSLVTRSRWTEEYLTAKKERAVRVYSEVMLVVRGCFVSEAIGEMTYYPHNAKTTYADAIEGSKTAAFRRLAKDFGVGLQAWKKGWCEGWWQRKATRGREPAKTAANGNGPSVPQDRSTPLAANIVESLLQRAAENGMDALKAAWSGLTNEQRRLVGGVKPEYKKRAAVVDAGRQGDAYEGDVSEGIN